MKVGVVIPNKNGGRFLRDAIESVLSQDYPDIECLVMDSLSTDESATVVEEFKGMVAWRSEPDRCAAEAINRGWATSDASILAWLNSDDMWAPGAVTRVVEAFRSHPEADVVSGECATIDEAGAVRGLWRSGPFDLVRSVSKADHILNQPAVFVRKDALERVGWLREIWLHDHDLWLRLGLSGAAFLHLDETLAFGRERSANLGNDAALVAPQRVRIIEDFFARDDVPTEIRRLERRAMSWAYARGAGMYLRSWRDFGKGLRWLARAFRYDPTNAEIIAAAARRVRDKLPSVRRHREAPDPRGSGSFSAVPVENVQQYWDDRPCNIRHSAKPVGTHEYFDEVEAKKYLVEPHIPSFAQFERWKECNVLEVGCGIGTDTINFARAAASVTAVELSERSLELAKKRAEIFGLADRIHFVNGNAEELSHLVPNIGYELIYSFGVIHHSPDPQAILQEMRSLAGPETTLKLMVYNRRSWKVAWIVLRYGRGRFWRARQLVAKYSEAQIGSPVTYCYTRREFADLLRRNGFRIVDLFVDHIFPYRIPDYVEHRFVKVWYVRILPKRLFRWLESRLGWHLCVTAVPEGRP